MHENRILLAIVPGGQRIGYAIFRGTNLIFYGITGLTKLKRKKKIFKATKLFLNKTLKRFCIEAAVMRKLTKPQTRSERIQEIADKIEAVFTKKGIKVSRISSTMVNEAFCGPSDGSTNERTAEFLVLKYPELARYHGRKPIWRKNYYGCLFQAIALGLYVSNEKMSAADNNKRD